MCCRGSGPLRRASSAPPENNSKNLFHNVQKFDSYEIFYIFKNEVSDSLYFIRTIVNINIYAFSVR